MPEDLLSFLTTRIKKMVLWKTTFVSEHLHSLHVLSVAVLTIPANSAARVNHAKSAKHTVAVMCSFKHARILISTNAKMCLKDLCRNKKYDS